MNNQNRLALLIAMEMKRDLTESEKVELAELTKLKLEGKI